MTALEYRILADLAERGIVYSVSPTGQIVPIRVTYFLAADADDPLIQTVCLNRATAVRKSLEIRGLPTGLEVAKIWN